MSEKNKYLAEILLQHLADEYSELQKFKQAAKDSGRLDSFWQKQLPTFMDTLRQTAEIARANGLNSVLAQISTYSETVQKKSRQTNRDRAKEALARADEMCEQLVVRDDAADPSDIKVLWRLVQEARKELM
jgi:hypothetical protein